MQPRRRQPPITIRSARAVELLKRHAVNGRSQAQVIEEALERLPDLDPAPIDPRFTPEAIEARMARYDEILKNVPPHPAGVALAEADAQTYDEWGDCL